MRVKFLIILSAFILLGGCDEQSSQTPAPVLDNAVAARGADLIRDRACGSCHRISGIDEADGTIGPPLSNWSDRAYIAGKLPNNTDNLVLWLTDTHRVAPETAMPELDLTEREARHIAAYLFSMREETL